MAYDEGLAQRIRDHFDSDPDMIEKKMFGGVAYMVRGNMAVGVIGAALMVRVDKEMHDSVLDEPGVSEMEMGERTMRGFVVVGSDSIADDASLASWIDRGVVVAENLPPK